jgi:hypothetical protein
LGHGDHGVVADVAGDLRQRVRAGSLGLLNESCGRLR